MFTKTTEWEHYDEAAIAIAASLIESENDSIELARLARRAYNAADALAQEAHRRRLMESITLYDHPVAWIKGECAPEKRIGQSKEVELGQHFLWQMQILGFNLGESFQEAIANIEELKPHDAAQIANCGNEAEAINKRRWAAADLLKRQLA